MATLSELAAWGGDVRGGRGRLALRDVPWRKGSGKTGGAAHVGDWWRTVDVGREGEQRSFGLVCYFQKF